MAHSVARRSDGSVVAWGWNSKGQCNVPSLPAGQSYVEIAAGGWHSLARRSEGSVVAWGDNSSGQCNVPSLPAGYSYVEIAAGDYLSLVRYSSSSSAPFCTAKSTLACGAPNIDAIGTPSASATSGFVVHAGPARTCRQGVLLYNTSAAGGVPFQGGTLCVSASQLRRGGSTNSQGSPGGTSCDGDFSIDMNSFAAGAWVVPDCAGLPSGLAPNNPAAYLRSAGQDVYCQFWGRDTLATGSFVSNAIRYTIAP